MSDNGSTRTGISDLASIPPPMSISELAGVLPSTRKRKVTFSDVIIEHTIPKRACYSDDDDDLTDTEDESEFDSVQKEKPSPVLPPTDEDPLSVELHVLGDIVHDTDEVDATLRTSPLLVADEELTTNVTCPGCIALDLGEGGYNQMDGHVGEDGCLSGGIVA